MKFPVVVTETFTKFIIVEAKTEEEAIDKCWNEFYDKKRSIEYSPVYFEYLDRGETDFNIASEEDKETIMKHENHYDYLN